MDAPALADQDGPSTNLGLELWKRGVALATSSSCTLLWWETVLWKRLPVPVPKIAANTFGFISAAAAPLARTPVALVHTGDGDPLARRWLPLLGAPAHWYVLDEMTHNGMRAFEFWCEFMFVGLSRHVTGVPLQWLLAYPHLLPPTIDNPSGVGFRRVEALRACVLHEKAPLDSNEPWP